jgi:hypothetical protein
MKLDRHYNLCGLRFLLIFFCIYECQYGVLKFIQTSFPKLQLNQNKHLSTQFVDAQQPRSKLRLCGFGSTVRVSLPKRLAPQSRVLRQKLTVSQLIKKFPAFYSTRSFITPFVTTRHLSLSRARSIHSTPCYPVHFIFIVYLHLIYAYACHMPRPPYLPIYHY